MKIRTITRCLSLLICSTIAARAGTHNWNGLGSTTNWSTAANWQAGFTPTALEAQPVVLVFPAGGFKPTNVCNIANLKVDSLIINGSSYALNNPSPVALPITLIGNGNSLYSAGTDNIIRCPLVLSSANLNFGTSTVGELWINGAMSGTGGFNKTGRGDVFLAGDQDNIYTGTTTVLGGTLHLAKTSGRIAVGGELVIGDLNGSSLPNFALDSTVILDGPQQLLFSAAVTVNPDGLLDMNGQSLAISSLTMTGNSKIDSFTGTKPVLTLFGNVSSSNPTNAGFNPSISCRLSLGGGTRTFTVDGNQHLLGLYGEISSGGGNAGIIKNGLGGLTLYEVNGYTGDTLVNAGTLYVFGSLAGSNVTLKPSSTLRGPGATGAVQCLGATIEPQIYKTSGQPAQHLRTKALAMDAASTLQVHIDEGYLFDAALLSVAGPVNLGGCRLAAELDDTGGISPVAGVAFVIIQNDLADPVIGSFAGLPEGTLFKFSGRQWKITYKGGDGNDVMLTVMSAVLPLSLDSFSYDPVSKLATLTGNGTPGDNTYRLETSEDLKTWTDRGGINNTYGNLTVYLSASSPTLFFRFVKP
ncbi:MAG: hypothetical protein EAZ42_10515 [Verrucomicrobia bacterium]|nr:MAG: hypothetical protein EAZ42_10515 [Verrucomicrobiota bacterium]